MRANQRVVALQQTLCSTPPYPRVIAQTGPEGGEQAVRLGAGTPAVLTAGCMYGLVHVPEFPEADDGGA
jgi:hypothetical protein